MSEDEKFERILDDIIKHAIESRMREAMEKETLYAAFAVLARRLEPDPTKTVTVDLSDTTERTPEDDDRGVWLDASGEAPVIELIPREEGIRRAYEAEKDPNAHASGQGDLTGFPTGSPEPVH